MLALLFILTLSFASSFGAPNNCNPGSFQGQTWFCQSNRFLVAGSGGSCTSGWLECQAGCNPGTFGGQYYRCTSNSGTPVGSSCVGGSWQLCFSTTQLGGFQFETTLVENADGSVYQIGEFEGSSLLQSSLNAGNNIFGPSAGFGIVPSNAVPTAGAPLNSLTKYDDSQAYWRIGLPTGVSNIKTITVTTSDPNPKYFVYIGAELVLSNPVNGQTNSIIRPYINGAISSSNFIYCGAINIQGTTTLTCPEDASPFQYVYIGRSNTLGPVTLSSFSASVAPVS